MQRVATIAQEEGYKLTTADNNAPHLVYGLIDRGKAPLPNFHLNLELANDRFTALASVSTAPRGHGRSCWP